MPYKTEIDDRIRELIEGMQGLEAKKMFGGICHLHRGNMFCGVYKDNLILRLGDDEANRVMDSGQGLPFDITGKAMKGWVMVPWSDEITDDMLGKWLDKALAFVKTLQPGK